MLHLHIMKKTSIYLFIIALKVFILVCAGALYMHFQMEKKIGVIQNYHIEEKLNSSLELGRNLQEKVEKLNKQKEVITKVFLSEDILISFIQKTESIGQNNNLEISIETIKRGETNSFGEGKTTQSVDFFINIKGEYVDIKNFIEETQSLETIINVSDIRIYKTFQEDLGEFYSAIVVLSGNILTYD